MIKDCITSVMRGEVVRQNFIWDGIPVGAMATKDFSSLATANGVLGGVAMACLGFVTWKRVEASKKQTLMELKKNQVLAEVEGLEKKIQDLKLQVEEKERREITLRAIREEETQKIRVDHLLDQNRKQKAELENLKEKLDISRNQENNLQDLLNESEEVQRRLRTDFEEKMNAKDRMLEDLKLENKLQAENMIQQADILKERIETLENDDKEKDLCIENLKKEQNEEIRKFKEEEIANQKIMEELEETIQTMNNFYEMNKENDRAEAEDLLKQVNELKERIETLENDDKEKDLCIENLKKEQNEEIRKFKEEEIANQKIMEELEETIQTMNNFYEMNKENDRAEAEDLLKQVNELKERIETQENDNEEKELCIESLKKEQEEQKYNSEETMENNEIIVNTLEKMGEETTDDEIDNQADCSDVSMPISNESENRRQLIMGYLRNDNNNSLSDILPNKEFRVRPTKPLEVLPEESAEEEDEFECEVSDLPYVAKEEIYFPREPLKITTLTKEEKSHLIEQIETYTQDRPYHVTLGCAENPTKEEVEERYKHIMKSWIQSYGKFEVSEFGNWRLDDSGAVLGKLTDAYLYLRSSEEHRRLISLAMKLYEYTVAEAWGYLAKEHWDVDEEKMVSELIEKTLTIENGDSKEINKAEAENILRHINELNEKLVSLENDIKDKDECIEHLKNEQNEQTYNSGGSVMFNEEMKRLKEKDVENQKAIEELEETIQTMNNFYEWNKELEKEEADKMLKEISELKEKVEKLENDNEEKDTRLKNLKIELNKQKYITRTTFKR
ncbi:putative leucine-rich repeat-containing protein DDB_G0290503 [Palaemon carinicauda]|uniref:putative leucine-rich repeat-containing protein DDB_G0290503 n=1 Tax=Palaemon carinicauda TaxID=392227 RepID=UPI0035B59013